MSTPVEPKPGALAGGGADPARPAPHPVMTFIIEWGAVVALPSALLAVICPALGASATVTAIVMVAVCIAIGMPLAFSRVRRVLGRQRVVVARIAVAVPWVAITILGATNLYAHYYPAYDRWQSWQREIFTALDKCRGVPASADACMAHELATRQHPAMEGSGFDPRADLAFDLRAGSVLRQHPHLNNKLWDWLGVGDRFLGTGFSQPHLSRDYAAARIPEVLIPNFSDSHESVWTWVLEPVATNLSRTVAEVIYETEPMQATSAQRLRDFGPFRKEIRHRITTFNDSRPPVIRFVPITREKYSGCLGKPERLRVFASRLGPVINMTLGDATQFSGYVVKPEDVKSDLKLYVMVFVPSQPDDIVSPTWREIVSRLEGWLREPKTCP